MAQFYAITYHRTVSHYTSRGSETQAPDYYIIAGPFPLKIAAEAEARATIGPVVQPGQPGVDMLLKTQHQNLRVVSKTFLKKYCVQTEEDYT